MKPVQMNQSNPAEKTGADMGSTEGARRATVVEPMSGDRKILHHIPPDPEVPEKKRRRKFTAK